MMSLVDIMNTGSSTHSPWSVAMATSIGAFPAMRRLAATTVHCDAGEGTLLSRRLPLAEGWGIHLAVGLVF